MWITSKGLMTGLVIPPGMRHFAGSREHSKEHLNPDSTAARFGGEEFLIVSRSSLEDTVKDLEQMRVRLSRHPLQIGADKIPISISAGICEILPETSFELAMRRADQALYEAKRGGRNSVWWHDGSRVIRH